jgi:hypothetical protein
LQCVECFDFLVLQVMARAQREQLRAMILDVTEGKDKARYKDLLK